LVPPPSAAMVSSSHTAWNRAAQTGMKSMCATWKLIGICRIWFAGVKFSVIGWTKDNLGFFYTRYPAPSSASGQKLESLRDPKIYYHRLGDSQDKDQLIYQRPDHPEWLLHASIPKNGRYLIITASENTVPKNAVYVYESGGSRPP